MSTPADTHTNRAVRESTREQAVVDRLTARLEALTERLDRQEQLLQQLQDITGAGLCTWNLQTDQIWWSDSMLAMVGIARDTLPEDLSLAMESFIHPDDRDRVSQDIGRMCSQGVVEPMQFRIIRPDGQQRVWQSSGVFTFDESGKPVHWTGVHVDITDRIDEEKTRLLAEQRFTQAFEHAAVAMALVHTDGTLMYVNQAASTMLGYTRQELLSLTFEDVTHPDDREMCRRHFEQMLNNQSDHYTIQKRYLHKDGHVVWATLTIAAVCDSKGQPVYHVAQAVDNTPAIEAERARRESESRFIQAFECAPIGMFVSDLDGSYILVNQAASDILGYSHDELLKMTFREFTHPDDLGSSEHLFQDMLAGNREHFTIDKRYIHKAGHTVNATLTCAIIRDEDGEPSCCVALVQDITERLRTEDALRRSEYEKSLILDTSSEMFAFYDTDLTVLWANKAAGDSIGQPAEALIGRHCYEVWHGRTSPCENCPLHKVLQTGHSEEAEIATPDGRYWFLRGYPVYDENGTITNLIEFGQDITERKRTEAAIRDSEQRFRTMFDEAADAIMIQDLETGRFLDVNKETIRRLGYTREELLTMTPRDIDTASQAAAVPERLEGVQRNGVITFETEHQHKNGRVIPTEVTSKIINYDEHSRYMSICRDITEHKRAADLLSQANVRLEQRVQERTRELQTVYERWRSLVDAAPDVVMRVELDGTILLANRSLVRDDNSGMSRKSIFDLIDAEYVNALRETIDEVCRTAEVVTCECTSTASDGTVRWYIHRVGPYMTDGQVSGLTWIASDITKRKQDEEYVRHLHSEIYHAGRINAMGELAATLAHELNQPLSAIVNYLSASMNRLHQLPCEHEQVSSLLEKAITQGHRAGQIIRKVRELTRRQEPNYGRVDIVAAIDEITDFMMVEFRRDHVRTSLTTPAGMIFVRADAVQLQQVLVNLVQNALQAMRSTTSRDARQLVFDVELQQDGMVRLAVRDSGPGIDEEVMPKLFDAFFTTRPSGHGMGLAISKAIVNDHGGQIWAANNDNRGATFYVTLPAWPDSEST